MRKLCGRSHWSVDPRERQGAVVSSPEANLVCYRSCLLMLPSFRAIALAKKEQLDGAGATRWEGRLRFSSCTRRRGRGARRVAGRSLRVCCWVATETTTRREEQEREPSRELSASSWSLAESSDSVAGLKLAYSSHVLTSRNHSRPFSARPCSRGEPGHLRRDRRRLPYRIRLQAIEPSA